MGQPLHAFDRANLQGGMVIRMAQPGEHLTLLDGNEVALRPETLVIADHSGPLAMAGVMGGENSGVNESTQTIFLESAFLARLRSQAKRVLMVCIPMPRTALSVALTRS